MSFSLEDFVRESNRIEGILREPLDVELEAHLNFIDQREITVIDLERFVGIVAPGKRLRSRTGMNVYVGNHRPIPGGPEVTAELVNILSCVHANACDEDCYETHHQYETLHPFMDGNGRSGRVLWLWMMGGIERAPLGFLHHWYYQSLSENRPTGGRQAP